MFHQCLIPAVEKALCQPPYQIQPLIGLAQQECSAVGTDRPAVETGYDFPPPRPFKSEAGLDLRRSRKLTH